MKWFSHDTDALKDAKLQKVLRKYGLAGYGAFFALCEYVGAEDKGVGVSLQKFDVEDIAFYMGVAEIKWLKEVLSFFAELELISTQHWEKGVIYIPRLMERADTYTRRQRNRKAEAIDTGIIEVRQLVADYWNSKGLPQVVTWSKDRSHKLAVRWKSQFYRENWKRAVDKIAESDFCRGVLPGKNWKASIDWFVRSDEACVRAIEGKYDNKERTGILEGLGIDED